MAQCVADYIYVLRITNSESYTRKLMAWLQEQNPELHKRMQAELERERRKARDDLPAWLLE